MNKKLQRMKQEIERRGGVLHVEPRLPDELAELFLREILDCPECMEEARRSRKAARPTRPVEH